MGRMQAYRGFTVIELLITLSIIGIGLTLGLPSLQTFIQTSKLNAAASDMQAALARARLEAIARNTFVTVEPLATGWASGYKIFLNPNNNTSWTTASAAGALGTGTSVVTPTIIGQGASSSASGVLWPTTACDASTSLTYVTFDVTGRPRAATTGVAQTGRIAACTVSGGCSTPLSCKEIIVDGLGRMRVQAH